MVLPFIIGDRRLEILSQHGIGDKTCSSNICISIIPHPTPYDSFFRAVMESAFLERFSDATALVKLEFSLSSEYFRTCKGTFCVDDYGSFPISPARILLDSKVVVN
jgi:hypothetical protein